MWFSLRCSSLPRKPPPPTVRLLPCGTLSQNHPGKSFLNSDPQTPGKVKVKQKVAKPTLRPYGLYSPFNSPGQNTGVGNLSLLQGNLPNPEIEPRSPALWVDSLPSEPQGKPKNTGVGSLSLLWRIFLTQESNCGLLHCTWILYQLSYEGSP